MIFSAYDKYEICRESFVLFESAKRGGRALWEPLNIDDILKNSEKFTFLMLEACI